MSFVLQDYPGMPSVCALCGKSDCSVEGELWVHLTTIEDVPCIGMRCLHLIADNVGLTTQVIEREVVRPPTDEEIGRVLRQYMAGMDDHDSSTDTQSTNQHDSSDSTGQAECPAPAGATGTDGAPASRKPRTVRSGQTRTRTRRK